MSEKLKGGGRKKGVYKGSPAQREFIKQLQSGQQQTAAARTAYPNDKDPAVKGCKMRKHPFVVAEMDKWDKLKQQEDAARAQMQGRLIAIADVLSFTEKRTILAKIARDDRLKPEPRIKAVWADAKLAGEIVDLSAEVKEFEGRSHEELTYYHEHGYFPESAESSSSPAAGGGPAAGRPN